MSVTMTSAATNGEPSEASATDPVTEYGTAATDNRADNKIDRMFKWGNLEF